MQNKTIVFISCSWMGYGADYSLISIIKKLKEENINSLVVIPRKGRTEELFKQNNIDYIILPYKSWVHYRHIPIISSLIGILKLLYNEILKKKLLKKLDKYSNIVGIYSNTYTDCFGIMLAKTINLPHIQHIREFGKEDFKRFYDFGEKFSNKIVSLNSKKIICISDAVLRKHENKYNEDKIVKIFNGIPSSIKNKEDKDKNDEIVRIIMTGRLSYLKRQIVLLKACNELRLKNVENFKIYFAGDGKERKKLEKYVESNDLNKYVVFLGYKKDLKLIDYDIGIICSPYEAFGRVTAEYMESGLAVIGANGGATPEIVEDKKTGLLYEVDNYKDLAQKLEKLIEKKELREMYGEAGRKRFIELFNEKNYQQKIYEQIKEIMIIEEK